MTRVNSIVISPGRTNFIFLMAALCTESMIQNLQKTLCTCLIDTDIIGSKN
jgi:hypothetical protein